MHKATLFSTLLLFLLTGCTYHGKIHRGIYTADPAPARLDINALVISDQHIPAQISMTEPGVSFPHAFRLDTADGVAVAAADALATFIQRVDAGEARLQTKYDLVAEVSYQVRWTSYDCSQPHLPGTVSAKGICTEVTLSLRKPGEAAVLLQNSARRWTAPNPANAAAWFKWLNKHTLSLLLPITGPLYVQSQGNSLRRQLEKDLTDCLTDIVQQWQHPQNRLSEIK